MRKDVLNEWFYTQHNTVLFFSRCTLLLQWIFPTLLKNRALSVHPAKQTWVSALQLMCLMVILVWLKRHHFTFSCLEDWSSLERSSSWPSLQYRVCSELRLTLTDTDKISPEWKKSMANMSWRFTGRARIWCVTYSWPFSLKRVWGLVQTCLTGHLWCAYCDDFRQFWQSEQSIPPSPSLPTVVNGPRS